MALYLKHRGQLRQGYEQVQRQTSVRVIIAMWARLCNGMANDLSQVGMLTFGPALALSLFLTLRCSQCQGRERPCVGEPGGNSRPDMCGRCQPHYIRHVLLEMAGESFNTQHTHTYTEIPPELYSLYPVLLSIILSILTVYHWPF